MNAGRAIADDASVRAVLLRPTSPIFCAGADLHDWADVTPKEAQRLSALGSRAFQALADAPVPVVAVLEEAALGGGLELALACDLCIATRNASIGFPEPRLGNSPAWGGMSRLVDSVGPATARDMLLTGDVVSAEAAHRMGAITGLCEPAELADQLGLLVDSILACDTGTPGYIKMLSALPDSRSKRRRPLLPVLPRRVQSRRSGKSSFLRVGARRGELLSRVKGESLFKVTHPHDDVVRIAQRVIAAVECIADFA